MAKKLQRVPGLYTVGNIAEDLDVKIHNVLYIINDREIEAIGLVGKYRVYDQAGFDRIKSELEKKEGRRA